MQHFHVSALLAYATVAAACTLPTTPLSNTITTGFGILIQNPAFPVIHDRYMNLNPAGGGDKHLFLSPVPEPAFDLVLTQGAIAQGIIHAVIGGEYDPINNTTKMFMTERGDPKTIFQPTYACNPDTDEVQIELVFVQMERAPLGGDICVRIASGNRGYEFRYSPPGNPSDDPTNPCIRVKLIVKVPGTVVTTPTSSPSTTSSVTSTTTSVSTSTTSPSSVGSSTAPVSTSSTSTHTGSTSTTSTSTSSNAPTSPTHPTTVSSVWSFQECRTEATNMRALTGASFATDTMTLESCAAFCSSFNYFGTEYSRECFCGNTFNPGSVPAPLSDCNFLCKGNAQEFCGAGLRLSIYTKGAVSMSQSSSSSASSSASSSVSSSASSTQTLSSVSTTLVTSTTSTTTGIASTTTTSSISTGSSSPLPYTDMTSKGFAFLGCAPEERRASDGPGRTLTGALYAEDTMTEGKCVDFCLSKGYTYAGTEFSRECWCGNSVAPGRQPKTTVASLASCSNKCGGDTAQYCGGDAWLSLYKACPVGGACVNAVFT